MATYNSSALISALLCTVVSNPILACSRIVSTIGGDVIVGRNMDWFEPMQTKLWILPRGMERNGNGGENSLKWTSKYGSLATVVYNGATADGMNEKGLAASILYLTESDYGNRNPKEPGLSLSMWAQYFLDKYETVDEAVKDVTKDPFQPLMAVAGNKEQMKATVHLAITDKTGDTAVIEYINGKPVVFHGKQYDVMTNSPPYADQLENLKQYEGFGGQKPLPGTTEAADRFVRAAYYLKHLPTPKNTREAVAGVLSVMRNVSQPFGAADPTRPNISETLWRTAADLTAGLYFFESTLSPNIVWVNLKQINFDNVKSTEMFDFAAHPDAVGDITDKFEKATMFQFIPASSAK